MLPRPDFLPNAKCKARPCEARFDGKDLILTLPDLWGEERPPKTVVETPKQNAGTSQPPARGTLTGSLMGDPPTGRSALDRKR